MKSFGENEMPKIEWIISIKGFIISLTSYSHKLFMKNGDLVLNAGIPKKILFDKFSFLYEWNLAPHGTQKNQCIIANVQSFLCFDTISLIEQLL